MLSLSSLLNPAPSSSSNENGFPPSPESSSPTDSCAEEPAFRNRSAIPKHKMPKDAAVFTKGKPKGAINFQPYEDLDEVSLHRTRTFQVYPLGKIREYSRHIPYNSGKKDFFEKTGRESFEVFQYVFKVPRDDAEYAVMWDYNVGLVRMTPFFKCCKYPKTTPAKMLNSNPGLKEITHSITGGSIMAQGYWMPYHCAKAVCATFCYNISGALIPIFGPDFPSLCTQVDAPDYSRMIIDPAIVLQSTQEADYYRRLYSNSSTASTASASRNDTGDVGSKRERRGYRSAYDDTGRHQPRYRVRKTCVSTPGSENSPYTTDVDGEISPTEDRTSLVRGQPHHRLSRFLHSPVPSITTPLRPTHASSSNSSGWTPANAPHPPVHLRPASEYQKNTGPSPWLSAIPRFTTATHLHTLPYPNVNASRTTRLQPYAGGHIPSQLQSQPHAQSYHRCSHKQLPSPSEGPPHQTSSLPQTPRVTKRPAAQVLDDDTADYRGVPRSQQLSRHYYTNKENHAENRSVRLGAAAQEDDDEKPVGCHILGAADKKAALLLMNLSVRDLSKSSGRKARNVEGGMGVQAQGGGYTGNTDGGGDWDYGSRAGGAAKIGSDGVILSSLDDGFPRTKRIRSNSM
ncbi:hypothetical protein F5Y03DRAFT_406892 [Xylaria venustula]|nr:hypothetical protein F5Y03DRAFT_406892 [Xylaria venustula]